MRRYIQFQMIAMLAFGSAVAQQPTYQDIKPTLEDPDERSLAKNVASHLQANVKQTEAILEVFQKERGKWPESWEELDSHFNASIWESPKVRQTITRSFVLLPGVHGHMGPKVRLEHDATLMMVMTGPTERLSHSSGNTEQGRWALWRTTQGTLISLWHPEAEITSFSAWPEVQVKIDQYIKSIRGSDSASPNNPPFGSRQSTTGEPSLKRAPHQSADKRNSLVSWTISVVLLVIIAGLVWMSRNRRKLGQ